jgi:riboflavin kinase/FMN adenylyltransferase
MLKLKSVYYQYQLQEIPAHILNSISVSSTRIREAVIAGDMDAARDLLGYDYFFSGKVVEGNKLGRTLGYPTANLEITEKLKLIPGDGIYAVDTALLDEPGKIYAGMMSIGFRPTIGNSDRTIEVNIFDFDRMIYGETSSNRKKISPARSKIQRIEALKEQLALDKINAPKYKSYKECGVKLDSYPTLYTLILLYSYTNLLQAP